MSEQQEMHILRNKTGIPVEGGDFFAREEELAEHWERLETDNLLLLSPRRIGKTSFMKKLQSTAEQHDFQAIYVSVEDAEHEFAFVRRLYEGVVWSGVKESSLKKSLGKSFSRFIQGVNLKKAGIGQFAVEFTPDAETAWRHLGEALLRALVGLNAKQGGRQRWLLMIDELPIFQRLEKELLPTSAAQALALLEAVARSKKGRRQSDLKRDLRGLVPDPEERSKQLRFQLRVLEGDGYLRREGDGAQTRFFFRSSLLQAYWLRYYC